MDLDQAFQKSCLDFKDLREKTKALGNDVLMDAVKVYIKMMYHQNAVIECMMACKKTNKTDFMIQLAKDSKKAVFDMGKKARPFMTHLRVIEDAFSLFNWFLLKETMDSKDFMAQMTEFAGGMDFQGAKILDMKPEDKEWYKSLRKVHYNFAEFVKANFPKIVTWKGDCDLDPAFWEGFVENSQQIAGEVEQASLQPAPVAAPV